MILWAAAALAGQLAFEADRSGGTWDYEVAWTAAGARRTIAFALPARAVQADNQLPRKPDLLALAQAQARAVRAWARSQPGVDVDVAIEGTMVRWGVSGTDAASVQGAVRDAGRIAEGAKVQWLESERVFVVERNALAYDHARFAADYADDVAAIARAVPGEAPREWIAEALAFVQAIPYEVRGDGGDLGFRPPLALLDRNRGDCDAKVTLFLALLRARFPELEAAAVYVPNHALVAIGIPPEPGDDTLKIGGNRWVLAEPVGPRESLLGEAPDGHARQAKRGVVRLLSR